MYSYEGHRASVEVELKVHVLDRQAALPEVGTAAAAQPSGGQAGSCVGTTVTSVGYVVSVRRVSVGLIQ